MGKHQKDNKQKNEEKRKQQIREDAVEFGTRDVKKYIKKYKKSIKKRYNDECYESDKAITKICYHELVDLLPNTIEFLLTEGYGQREEIKELRMNIYSRISDKKFIKFLKRDMEDEKEIENLIYLPVFIADIVNMTNEENKRRLAEDPNTDELYDLSDLVELSKLILQKRLKKLKKAGIPDDLAYDILSVIPTPSIVKYGLRYRIRTLFWVIYEHAKTKDIDVKTIIEKCFPEERLGSVCIFCLLERRDKLTTYTDGQKKVFDKITMWVFDYLENEGKDYIETVLDTYVRARKRDDEAGKDGDRRVFIKSISATDYPKVVKVANKMLVDDPTIEKYF